MKHKHTGRFSLLVTASILTSVAGCTPPQQCLDVDALPAGSEIQIIGDSVFDFNEETCEDVSDFMSLSLGATVEDRSIGGTWLDHPEDEDIADSYAPGPWPWLIVDGGGNDLLGFCNCECSSDDIARLINPDGTDGAMSDLIRTIVDNGSRVILLGYYQPTPDSEFGGCIDELEVLSSGYSALADQLPEVTFLDARNVINAEEDRSLLHTDGVHLTPKAAEILANAMLSIVGSQSPND